MKKNSTNMSFYDNCIPSLKDGIYKISAESNIEGIDTEGYFKNVSQKFEVRASSFLIREEDMCSVYPAPNSYGRFSENFPSVVFKNQSLPWEVSVTDDTKIVPWLFLLVLSDAELKAISKSDEVDIDKDGAVKFSAEFVSKNIGKLLDNNQDFIKPDLKDISDDEKKEDCTILSVSGEFIKERIPSITELPYLAHVRETSVDQDDSSAFSVIISNRLPVTDDDKDVSYHAYVLSMEGWGEYLKDLAKFEDNKKYGFISLYNWSFVSQKNLGSDFGGLLNGIVSRAENPSDMLLKMPDIEAASGEEDDVINKKLQQGYLPLEYKLISGEETFCFYRGPFASRLLSENLLNKPCLTASAAVKYDEKYGLFDQSYASAWQLGRFAALSDSGYLDNLESFYREGILLLNKIGAIDGLSELQNWQLKELLADDSKNKFSSLLKSDFVKKVSDKIDLVNNEKEIISDSSSSCGSREVVFDLCDNVFKINNSDLKKLILDKLDIYLQPILGFLQEMCLLKNVPFHYLVPDNRMLPFESIKLFYVDKQWLTAMIDGAITIGAQSLKKSAFYKYIFQEVYDLVISGVNIVSGLFLNSELVSNVPDFKINFYKNDKPVNMVVKNKLSSCLVICLLEDIPDSFEIIEPEAALNFGVASGNKVYLRSLQAENFGANNNICIDLSLKEKCLSKGAHVMNLSKFVEEIKGKSGKDKLFSSEFGIQILQSPERVVFCSK